MMSGTCGFVVIAMWLFANLSPSISSAALPSIALGSELPSLAQTVVQSRDDQRSPAESSRTIADAIPKYHSADVTNPSSGRRIGLGDGLAPSAERTAADAKAVSVSSEDIQNLSVFSRTRVLVALLLVVAILAIASFSLLLRNNNFVRDELLGRDIVNPADRLVEYVTSVTAERAASERLEAIRSFLREHNLDITNEDLGPLRAEFLEQQTFLPDIQRASFSDDEASGLWHALHLRWQVANPEWLLAERVADVVTLFSRSSDSKSSESPWYAVHLAPLPRKLQSKGSLFPWRVIVESSADNRLVEQLREALRSNSELRNWIGIGVDWRFGAPPHQFAYGHCTAGQGGYFGTVGGSLRSLSDDDLGVTCAHVLSDGCASLRWPAPSTNGSYNRRRPDAAVIDTRGPCFAPQSFDNEVLRILPNAELKTMVLENEEVVGHSQRGPRRGIVRDLVCLFKLSGVEYRGPHLSVIPKLSRAAVTLPLVRREFSQAGDSGSWVLDDREKTWIGIVIGGCESPFMQTYVLTSCLLGSWFSKGLGSLSLGAHVAQ